MSIATAAGIRCCKVSVTLGEFVRSKACEDRLWTRAGILAASSPPLGRGEVATTSTCGKLTVEEDAAVWAKQGDIKKGVRAVLRLKLFRHLSIGRIFLPSIYLKFLRATCRIAPLIPRVTK